MALPVLWTRRRLAEITGLAGIGVLQAAAGLAVAAAGSKLLTGSNTPFDARTLTVVLVVAAASFLALRVLQRRFAEAFALHYVAELRSALISHVIRVPPGTAKLRFGMVMTRVVNDLSAIKLWLASGLVSIVVAASMLATLAVYLILREPQMALALGPALGIWALLVLACLGPLDTRIRRSRRERGRIAARAGAILGARQTLLIHGRHGQSVRALDRRSRKMNAAMIGRATLSGLLRASGDLVLPAVALTVALGLSGTGSGPVSAGQLGILIMITGIVAAQLNAVAVAADYRLAHRVALARLRRVLGVPAIDLDAGKAALRRGPDGRRLTVDRVAMRPTGRVVSFDVETGAHVMVKGLSALESRDLFARVARLADPGNGRVLIDGSESGTVRPGDWWRAVAMVSETLRPMPGTVARNATLGSPSWVPEGERIRVLALFGLDAEGRQIKIGEDEPLPGDTAAAMRAARGLLRRPGLLLVDDPELLARDDLLNPLLDEAQAQGMTVVLAPDAPRAVPDGCQIIDLTAPLRVVA